MLDFRYENTNADLPRLLHSHEEQLRILCEKNKSQRKMLRELNELLKVKEEELVKVQDKLSHLEQLNRYDIVTYLTMAFRWNSFSYCDSKFDSVKQGQEVAG